jgi:LacI family transcriptional regulator
MRIAATTVDRVFEAARSLDYRRRLLPRSSLPAGAPALGLISDVVATESFAGEMLRGAIAAGAERGHVVLIADSEGVADLEVSAIRALLSRGVDKFAYATMATVVSSVPQALRDQRLVLMNNIDPRTDAPVILPDDHEAGRAAAQALLDEGHTSRIWLVGRIQRHAFAGRHRLDGINAALTEAGHRLAGNVECGWWPDEARVALTERFATGWSPNERPTAIIAINDRAAMGVYQAASAAGLRIPHDISVISFDNSDLSRWLHPALSSLGLPYFDIGQRAVELLLDDERPKGTHRLPMTLRTRESVTHPHSS